MAYINLQYFDSILQNQTTVHVILPDEINGPLQTIYLLHGLGDDGSVWHRKTRLEALVRDYQVAVIMPSAPRSCYLDINGGLAVFSFISKSLPHYLNQILPLSNRKEDHFLMGNSMGGFGALHWLTNSSDYFSKAAVLSPVVDLKIIPDIMPDYRQAFGGNNIEAEQLSTKKLADILLKTPLFWTIGSEDFLLEQNQKLQQTLHLHPESQFDIQKGTHDWAFWDRTLEKVIPWFKLRK